MNADGLRLLIVDDHPERFYGGFWKIEIESAGGEAVLLPGKNSTEFTNALRHILANDAERFDGTILDIAFQNEPTGGKAFWVGLHPDERERLGLLFVHSKVYSEDDLFDFARDYAGGRLSIGADKDSRRAKLGMFLRDIRRHKGWPP